MGNLLALAKQRWTALAILSGLLLLLFIIFSNFASPVTPARAADGDLEVSIIAGYNLVVDSNVTSPSTYGPSVATVIGKFCNTTSAPLENVVAYIGDYASTAPGVYPARLVTNTDYAWQDSPFSYSFTHLGGAADASRLIGDIPAYSCRYQYWSFTYPRCENNQTPPCTGSNDPTWGSSSSDPTDDLSLSFDVWGKSLTDAGLLVDEDDATWAMTMRNEISAMANKIEPNPDGYWITTNTNVVRAGEVITSNGVLYTFGNVNKGFDNDGDLQYDYNAWMQPFGDPSYDPSCFRLIRTTGTLTVARSGGFPDLLLNFTDNLYFTNLPEDNTNVTGVVRYTFLALGGSCTTNMTPYQEAASGADNEKFNADYGTGIPPIVSSSPAITVDKSGTPLQAEGGTISYSIPFENSGDGTAGLTLSSGYGIEMPFTIQDTVPPGLEYDCDSAALTLDYGGGYQILYSADGGLTWGNQASIGCPTNPTSTTANPVVIRWVLSEPLPARDGDPNTSRGTASFTAVIPSGFITATGSPVIENTACANLGGATTSLDCGTATTLVSGTAVIGDLVWRDLDGDGVQDGGSETGIPNITLNLYWDANNDDHLDDGDTLISQTTTDANGNYTFSQLPAGSFLVAVDNLDADLPQGYSQTSPVLLDQDLIAGQSVDTLDFGFGPTLLLDKILVSTDPVKETEPVIYDIKLTNTRPASSNGFCQHYVWATIAHTDNSLTPPGGGNAGSQFQNTSALLYEPDGQFAVSAMNNNTDFVGISGFNADPPIFGTITNVQFQVYSREAANFKPTDNIYLRVFYGDVQLGSDYTYNGGTYFTGAAGTDYLLTSDITALRTWNPSDFTSNLTEMQIEANQGGGGGASGDIAVDAVAYVITTDQHCGGAEDTISVLPLTDTYDPAMLQFESATIAPDSTTPAGTLTWNNLGPLYGGETLTIRVTFTALDPGAAGIIPTDNTASVTGARFASGRSVNDASDTEPVNLFRTANIGDFVWNDVDADGVQDPGEDGIAGVTMRLCTTAACTTVVRVTTTDADGYYSFTAVDGTFYVNVQTAPGTFTYDRDGAVNGNGTAAVTVAGTDDNTLDFGYTLTTSRVFGRVWEDNNGNDIQETGENGFLGVTVQLCNDEPPCSGGGDTSTTTNANGDYLFTGLAPGTYWINVQTGGLPGGAAVWSQTLDPDSTLNSWTLITITSAGIYGPYDFAYQRTPASSQIGDTVYLDWNGDGTQDTGEQGISGVTIYLYEDANANGLIDPTTDSIISTQVTDANGAYLFTSVPAGSYLTVVDRGTLPTTNTLVQTGDPDQVGTCVVCDSRGVLASVNGTSSYLTQDFGYQPAGGGSVGDYVWADSDGDGVQDTNETGIANITVNLYEDSDSDGLFEPAGDDALVATTVTDSDGAYLFENLPYARFWVDVDTSDADLPTNAYGSPYLLSTANDPDLVELTLLSPSDLTADFGFAPPGAIGDFIWQDNDADGVQDTNETGLSGVTLTLYTYTDSDADGQWDSGEPRTSLATDTTDSSGYYEFQNLPPNDYYVVEVTSGVPAGYSQTYDPDAPTSAIGCASGCNTNASLTLDYGQVNHSIDFAFRPLGRMGDTLWVDLNGDGARSADEPGIGDVTLYLCATSPCSSANDLATVVTDSNGNYAFGNQPDGTYYVAVDTATLPTGYTQTYEENDATPDNTTTVVLSGGYVSSINAVACSGGPGDCDLDVDFGYQYDLTGGTHTVSGTIFFDAGALGDPFQAGDNPYPGIYVYLYTADNVLIATTRTDAAGNYSFTGLPPAIYRVSYDQSGQLAELEITYEPDEPDAGNNLCEIGDNCNNWTQVDLTSSDAPGRDFGMYAEMDCGDLPSTYEITPPNYSTQLAANGPCHVRRTDDLNPNTHTLGAAWDTEFDGQPSDFAIGDDTLADDEDGISLVPNEKWSNGSTVHITATVSFSLADPNLQLAYLAGWFDWDSNGQFESDEYRYFGQLSEGPNTLELTLPADCCSGVTLNTRFRLYQGFSPPAVISPTGMVLDGEVEDYQWYFSPTSVELVRMQARPAGLTPVSLLAPLALIALIAGSLALGWKLRRR